MGARLMAALKRLTGGMVSFVGIGGERMAAEGLRQIFPLSELAHMGILEVAAHLPNLLRRIDQTIAEVKRLKPAALITIDSPDFCFRVAKKLKGEGVPLIHYVAPSVWAWRPERAAMVAQFLDHVLALLPFEPEYFTREGLNCTFVGHPIVESGAASGQGRRFRERHGISGDAPVLTVLPGSRMGEVKRLMPVFRQTIKRLKRKIPNLQVVLPVTGGNVASFVEKAASKWPVPVFIAKGDGEKYDAFNASFAALACSGTVSVELAMAGLPMVVAYRVNPLTALFARFLLKTKYATLVNIMHDKMIVPEFLQWHCTPKNLAGKVLELLRDPVAARTQKSGLSKVASWLGAGSLHPSEKAAGVVLEMVRNQRPESVSALTMRNLFAER